MITIKSTRKTQEVENVEQAAQWCASNPAAQYNFNEGGYCVLRIKGSTATWVDEDWWAGLEDYERDFVNHLLGHLQNSACSKRKRK